MQSDPRLRFFNEEGEMLPPFKAANWRGCCVDPDQFTHPKMPQVLFEAVVAAAKPSRMLLQQYTPDDHEAIELAPIWSAFSELRERPDRLSLEYILFDVSGSWAFLLDPDMLVFGAEAVVAERVDAELAKSGASLLQLTVGDYPRVPPSSHMYKHMVQVLGTDPWQGAP